MNRVAVVALRTYPFLGMHISVAPVHAQITLSWTLRGAAPSPGRDFLLSFTHSPGVRGQLEALAFTLS